MNGVNDLVGSADKCPPLDMSVTAEPSVTPSATPSHVPAPAPPAQSSLSFTQGFVLGQISIVILIGAFIKFFIFGEPGGDSAILSSGKRRKSSLLYLQRQKSVRKKRSSVLRQPPPLTTNAILTKTYYHVDSHNPESLDWFNVLVAQMISQLRSDAHHNNAVVTSLTTLLNGDKRPDFISDIKITELSLGEDFPIFSNCRIVPIEVDGVKNARLQARMDVDLSDFITLGIETKVILNYPKPLVAVLPVALAVSVVRFSGTVSLGYESADKQLSISFVPSEPPAPGPTTLEFSFMDDYRLDLSVRSLLGSRARLQDIPKLAQLVESQLHKWFDERCVEPRFQQVVLPNIWPRMQNTRGGDEAVDDELLDSDDETNPPKTPERARNADEGLRRRNPPERVGSMPGAMPE